MSTTPDHRRLPHSFLRISIINLAVVVLLAGGHPTWYPWPIGVSLILLFAGVALLSVVLYRQLNRNDDEQAVPALRRRCFWFILLSYPALYVLTLVPLLLHY